MWVVLQRIEGIHGRWAIFYLTPPKHPSSPKEFGDEREADLIRLINWALQKTQKVRSLQPRFSDLGMLEVLFKYFVESPSLI